MTTAMYEVENESPAFSSATETWIAVAAESARFSDPRLAPDVPQMIPRDQLPFWMPEWQEILKEGRDALAAGESVEFANFKELAMWLLSPEDDDD